jgi:hypothetical protein
MKRAPSGARFFWGVGIVSCLFRLPTCGYYDVPQDGITRQTSDAAKFASLQFFVSQLNLLPSLKKPNR